MNLVIEKHFIFSQEWNKSKHISLIQLVWNSDNGSKTLFKDMIRFFLVWKEQGEKHQNTKNRNLLQKWNWFWNFFHYSSEKKPQKLPYRHLFYLKYSHNFYI